MKKVISIGNQGFDIIREQDCFLVDKTKFIKEWWEGADSVTLITRPRRFGKTLNMSMLNCFFSNKYSDRGDLFEGFSIWKEEKFRKLQGTYTVIFLSFADVKQTNYKDAIQKIKNSISELYGQFKELESGESFSEQERCHIASVNSEMSDVAAQDSLKNLSSMLERYYGKKAIILLDEYDTPMQETYIHGYYSGFQPRSASGNPCMGAVDQIKDLDSTAWEPFTSFIRSLFNATFKTNPYMERAVMTGVTRVSNESIFSDLNNLRVVTTTSDMYADCFGFTEEEVFASLDDFSMEDKKEVVKQWYDGFTFGTHKDIYNPWSITNFLKEKKLQPYWANTSSNALISKLIQKASADVKQMMEDLLHQTEVIINFDEQIVFNQLDTKKGALWSLMVASCYLKVENVEYRGNLNKPWYHLSITNLETMSMFSDMFADWFDNDNSNYNAFINALLKGDLQEMNIYMNDVALSTFSNFDVGTHPSGRSQPERFYHGFVLGLLVDLQDDYELKSNRESGYGRYDVMLIPKDIHNERTPAIVLEFKVYNPEYEDGLESAVSAALKQIEYKNYDAELISHGIVKEKIYHYGFAFEGKKVLIGA